ncbi:LSM-domain-containing protein [Saitoella complicata NRRL Y-17804]|uniref:LSM-domain-containing protein n=1 Tax=Saitoella complicata (strain BCRC 22490 / CBS 7301 / JCM 7358 / NBRC 10748 / NRRL Y-17804) TaxID=698492 RepID=UPI000866BEA9|nr:LSM-domain-containing protein [Saitoella complicata NRRL Y-17804]ODQ49673.1 LSM-domain-containing protein [Saitoella complicata NRRL Y-17804]
MSALTRFIEKQVTIITCDGRLVIGILKAFDQTTNIVLSNTIERVLKTPLEVHEAQGEEIETEVVVLGLYVIRGDNVAVIGLTDMDIDGRIDWGKVRGEAIGGTKHL